jgi:histidine triad (HIT) family protein
MARAIATQPVSAKPYDLAVPECLFCDIAAGRIPAAQVLATDRVVAFRDIDPQAPVHVLVIPKEHYPDLGALAAADAGLLHEVITQAHQVAVAEGVTDGYRVVFNTGPQAGQTVPHVHAHVLGGRAMGWPPG